MAATPRHLDLARLGVEVDDTRAHRTMLQSKRADSRIVRYTAATTPGTQRLKRWALRF